MAEESMKDFEQEINESLEASGKYLRSSLQTKKYSELK